MTKKLGLIGALLSLIGATLIPAGPAQAAFAPWLPDPIVYTVGDTVSLDLGCGENDVTNVYYQNGQLPDGLTMSNLGLVTGIPTTPGTFTISGYHCSYNGGWYAGYIPSASVTFQINAVPTPTPILVAHSLNTQDCSFYVGMLFTVLPDDGTVYTEASNQAGTVLRSILSGPFTVNQMREGAITIEDLNNQANSPGFQGSLTGNVPFQCGDTLSITVGYQFQGAPVATQTVAGIIVDKPSVLPLAGGAPTQKLIPLNNDACEFRVLATLPSAPTPGSTHITINLPGQETNQLTFTISDQTASGLMDFTFSPETLSSGYINLTGIASEDYQVSSAWACGSTIYVNVDYRDLLGNYWSSTWSPQTNVFGVTPTRPSSGPVNTDFSISATQSSVGACSINVTAHVPDGTTSGPMGMGVTELEGTDWISGVYNLEMPITANGILTSTLSFTSKADMSANWVLTDEQRVLPEVRDCTGTFRVVLDTIGGVLAETVVTLGELMPSCNAGSTLDQEQRRCSPVERGFYTTELNSSTAIACPAGMTTATTASKSVNDCYKPIVQSIVGLKAPKALKFKGTVNLPLITNTKALAWFRVTGPCTAKLANIITKVKGKNVTTKMLKVTAGKKAGICLVDLTAPTSGKYLDLKKVVQIKVSKTGK
jgi:hypothetical protein